MKAEKVAPNRFRLDVSDDELRLLVGALGELCFGIQGFEFEARLGVPKDRAAGFAREVRQHADALGLEL